MTEPTPVPPRERHTAPRMSDPVLEEQLNPLGQRVGAQKPLPFSSVYSSLRSSEFTLLVATFHGAGPTYGTWSGEAPSVTATWGFLRKPRHLPFRLLCTVWVFVAT